MAFRHQVFPEHRLGVVWLSEVVTGAEIVKAHELLFWDKSWQPGWRVFWDVRWIKEMLVTPEDVQVFSSTVEKLKPAIGDARVAVVAHRETDQMIASMFTAKSSRILKDEQKVFVEMAEAAEWLGVPLSAIEDNQPD